MITASFSILMLASAAQSQSEDIRTKQLPNFHQVNQGLYRGAQPRQGGFQQLATLGIKTVLNLRTADERERAEAVEARAAGLAYFNIAMEGLDRPTHEQMERALEIINDTANQPVFLHCKRGADRTGMVIAIYRITRDGWSVEQALREAKRYGMSFFQFRMKDYIKDYGRNRAARPMGDNRRPRTDESESVENSVAALPFLLRAAKLRLAPLHQRAATVLLDSSP